VAEFSVGGHTAVGFKPAYPAGSMYNLNQRHTVTGLAADRQLVAKASAVCPRTLWCSRARYYR
jgi:hypothetical protein